LLDSKAFYITTPIYYVNGVPHVGSATTTLLADAIARYHRQQGERVFFLTGTDEHGQKVADAAARVGKSTQQLVDETAQGFIDTWRFLDISYDDFIRTSQPRHMQVVREVFKRLLAQGDIYAGKYEGWYSIADETFFRDTEVKDGRAIESGAAVVRVTQDNYFFRQSAYAERLLAYIEDNPDFLTPETRRNEVISFIKAGLRDVAITRPNTGWDIEVPGDPAQTIYVWFDAVINYLSITGWPDNPAWDTLWPADVHLVGKEIYTRFHATLWPAMLMALGLPLPGRVAGHGWWTIKGEKASKSKGNIPTPQEVVADLAAQSGAEEAVCVDALRYYLIRDISFTSDAEFSLVTLVSRYNFDLANDLGNLLNRTLNMVHQYRGGVVPSGGARATAGSAIAALAEEVTVESAGAMDALDPGAALASIWRLVGAANKEIDTSAPWKLNKAGDTEGLDRALYTILEINRILSVLIHPVMPHVADAIRRQLGITEPAGAWAREAVWGGLAEGSLVSTATPIFPRTTNKSKETAQPVSETIAPAAPAADAKPEQPAAPDAAPQTAYITYDDFAKIELRIAEIKTAEPVKGADRLLHLTIDAGDESPRQLVAGIAESYKPEDLPGRKIVIVANLQPRKLRGVESQGMLLAATDADGRAILLSPEKSDIAPGSKVK
jgi:methionyl-tRNA synthetase